MKKGDKKIFKDKQLLYKMINLRLCGWDYVSISILFKCDWKAIKCQCRKYDIDRATDDVYGIERIISNTLPAITEDRFIDMGGNRICRGHDYAYYLSHSKI